MRCFEARNYSRWLFVLSLLIFILMRTNATNAAAGSEAAASGELRFEISYDSSLSVAPLDGRLYLLVSTDNASEPRFQISDQPETQQFFGVNVDGWAPGSSTVVDVNAIGYPLASIARIPPGDYYVQALLNIYETFHRADGHVVKLPMDHGEGQQWNEKPGNLYSEPVKIHIDAQAGDYPHQVDQNDSADRAAQGHGVHQAHSNSKRGAHEILGTSDVSRSSRSVAAGMGGAPPCALSTHDSGRPFPA